MCTLEKLNFKLSRVVRRWKSDKQARDVRGHCIDSFFFLRHIPLDETLRIGCVRSILS